ncbi:XTP/dITP diphosphohydrolase [Amphibacillus marinus]|uniref:dITP/XTP pyrophosphatase n=1 Tax=Amphibacillus marinus TaxID=872970 RepID=A0A1H8SM68_9BACI|nr:XTP/dITP diphosphatase [Amphibacillus marinus]SEO79293.1 XTP/dITP diphosphohydrolase [Amphibacillus marinus]
MNKILIATKNKGKVNDFKGLFGAKNIEVISLLDLAEPIADIEETGQTFAENATLKAETIAKQLQLPVIADDSGLEIAALKGEPGVYSARYAGIEKNDQRNIDKVLENMADVKQEDRAAQFVCALALAIPGQETVIKHGYCKGFITTTQIGKNGFGYDPIFQPEGYDVTMAQLKPEEKNAISHRGNALKELAAWLAIN